MIINLFGGPGTGKSTLAAGLFHRMKVNGYSCELVTEFAKDLHWESREETLRNQFYVDAKQYRNLKRVADKVDYVITDAPLMKGAFYARYYKAVPSMGRYQEILESFDIDLGDQMNFFLKRNVAYVSEGRNESFSEATRLDKQFEIFMSRYINDYITIDTKNNAIESIMKVIK